MVIQWTLLRNATKKPAKIDTVVISAMHKFSFIIYTTKVS